MKNPICIGAVNLLSLLLVFTIVITWSAFPSKSYAQSGSRICLNEAGTYAVEIKKGRNQKKACKAGRVDSVVGRWGRGRYMTCEAYARTYLKWDYSPCHEMDRKRLWSNRLRALEHVYRVVPVPRDEDIKASGACGADTCSLGVTEGRTQSFGYQVGLKVNLSQVFQGEVKFTTTRAASRGWTYTCTYVRGHEPGMKILNTPRMRVYSALNYDDLFQATRCYTRGISEVDYEKQLLPKPFDQCPRSGNFILGMLHDTVVLRRVAEQELIEGDSVTTNYATAIRLFENAKVKQKESSWFGVSGTYLMPDDHSVRCSAGLTIATPADEWRDGTSQLQWKFAYYTKPVQM